MSDTQQPTQSELPADNAVELIQRLELGFQEALENLNNTREQLVKAQNDVIKAQTLLSRNKERYLYNIITAQNTKLNTARSDNIVQPK